jgi:hypothetical protein
VRGTARFCPQCGQPLAEGASADAAQASPRAPLVDEAERVASSLSGRLAARESNAREPDTHAPDDAALKDANVSAADVLVADDGATRRDVSDQRLVADNRDGASRASTSTASGEHASSSTTSVERASTSAADEPAAAVADESAAIAGESAAGRVRQRAAAVGATVGGSLRPRVGRLRERSVVVLDEAADDPGVRFVVVAAALFFVALLLYVFSFVLR